VTSAPSGTTADGQRLIAFDPATGDRTIVYEINEPYTVDQPWTRVVGYRAISEEVVLVTRDEQAGSALLLAERPGGEKRTIAMFEDRWIVSVSVVGDSIGVTLSRNRVDGGSGEASDAVLVLGDGSTIPLLSDGNVRIMGDISCTSAGTCCVPVYDESCGTDIHCPDAILEIGKGSMKYLDQLRGFAPYISPDGQWIALAEESLAGHMQYSIVNLENLSQRIPLGFRPRATAAWSSNSRFFSHLAGGPPPNWDLLVWDVDGKRAATATVPYRSSIVGWVNE